jgi:hypothetical protein
MDAKDARATRLTRLVHIGPHKTGTTTVQAAFHSNRGALRERGILYLGDQLQPTKAVKAVTGAQTGELQERGLRQWNGLVEEARSFDGSVVLSSEFLCEADDPTARRVLEDLGGEGHQPHVVVTLRPLSKILPSQWQQFIQSGSVTRIDEWLDWVLSVYDRQPRPLVWQRHRHHDLVARWSRAAGPGNLTVVVADESEPAQLPQVFAGLLGLPEDVLVPPTAVANRSLRMEEAEAVRLFNAAFEELNARRAAAPNREPLELTMDQRMAAWRALKRVTPDPDYHRIALPPSATEAVAVLARHMVEAISALGVHVIGDLESLAADGAVLAEDAVRPRWVRPELAAEVATAVLAQVMPAAAAQADGDPGHARAARVDAVTRASGLLRSVSHRLRQVR